MRSCGGCEWLSNNKYTGKHVCEFYDIPVNTGDSADACQKFKPIQWSKIKTDVYSDSDVNQFNKEHE